jgi:hypothetical protein
VFAGDAADPAAFVEAVQVVRDRSGRRIWWWSATAA